MEAPDPRDATIKELLGKLDSEQQRCQKYKRIADRAEVDKQELLDRLDKRERECQQWVESYETADRERDELLRRLGRFRDFVEGVADDGCSYSHATPDQCATHPKHALCRSCSAKILLDAAVVENQCPGTTDGNHVPTPGSHLCALCRQRIGAAPERQERGPCGYPGCQLLRGHSGPCDFPMPE